jgi:protein-histidine N-methyltransferase
MERIQKLVDWATRNGATLHPLVEVYDDATTGLSFRVKPSSQSPLAAWDQVVSLPTRLSLSYLNVIREASHDGVFPAEFVTQTPPHVVGRFFLAKQYLLGEGSFWWPYIQALPQPADEDSWCLPPFWPTDDAELLEGTNVEVGLEKIKADVRKEYAEATALLQQYGDQSDKDITMKLYSWAYCIFSSRSFKPSLVLAEEEQQILPDGISINDFSVLLPLFDIGNHDMTLDVRWELRKQDQHTCELRVGRSFQPGQQVFNNYSMKTNAELLLGYGFMIPPTEELHNDYTHVRKRTSSPSAVEEYYISRRPMSHSSSLLGRSRQGLALHLPAGKSIIGPFQHVQPDMVWDIFCTICPPEERARIMPSDAPTLEEQEMARRCQFFCGDLARGSEAYGYLEHTMAIIQHKVMQELERLDETDVELVDGQEEDLTRNQRLALEYRRRCRAVLENTLESLGLEEEGP